MGREHALQAIRAAAHELTGAAGDFDALVDRVGEAGCVLLGESTHGTAEFYATRAHITKRLIEEKGFAAVAVEADWPDAYRAGCWARSVSDDPDAAAALGDFTRFPRWMWRNHAVVAFLQWLREHNEATGSDVGFYGLDLYSLHASIDKVVHYLDRVDPAASARARARYGCFDHYGGDADEYGRAAAFGAGPSCETEVVEQLVELQRRAAERPGPAGAERSADAHFFAEQNARLVRNAERYHRAMFRVGPEAWNLRDRHMAETLDALRAHLAGGGRPGKVVVWAHNSHVGDARATELAELGQLTLGRLVREAYGAEAVLVGQSTFAGSVTAASDWGGAARMRHVAAAREDSTEALLHESGPQNLMLVLGAGGQAAAALQTTRLQRAIGVVYRPQTERVSHYVFADVTRQFDVLVHLDTTTALEPLEPGRAPAEGVLRETSRIGTVDATPPAPAVSPAARAARSA
jgi:erythromycin esterase-like protein